MNWSEDMHAISGFLAQVKIFFAYFGVSFSQFVFVANLVFITSVNPHALKEPITMVVSS